MSEKRFVQLGDTHIKDMVTGEEWYAPCETSLLELLNEQQATLNKQKEEIINSHIAYVESLNEIKDLKEENEELRRENKKKDIEIQSLNAHITNWLNETKIAKLYENEQYRTETLEKENEQLKHWNKCLAEKRHNEKKDNERLYKKLLSKIDFLERIIEGDV